MRFMVMHKVDAPMEAGEPPAKRIVSEMGAYVQGAIKAGVFQDGAGLHRSAQRVRVELAGGKRTVTNGPFSGGNQLVASFAMVQATSMDHAIDVATRVAGAIGDAEIEVGPVVEAWDLGIGVAKPADAPQRFLLLRKADRDFEAGAPERTGPVLDALKREGVLLSAATLAPSAKGARYRVSGGKRVWTDGPFTESKELIAGFSIIDVPSKRDAMTWAEAYAAILGDNEVDVREVAT